MWSNLSIFRYRINPIMFVSYRIPDLHDSRGVKKPIRSAGLTFHSSKNTHVSSDRDSATKVISQVLHPIDTIKSHKRKASDASRKSESPTSPKKLRAGQGVDNAIVINDDDDDDDDIQEQAFHNERATDNHSRSAIDNLDLQSVLDLFQLSTRKLE